MQRRVLKPRGTRGSALLEFTLVGITLLFIWVSIVEMALGMWNYHTLQYAVKMAAGYASVHGATCSISPNSCSVNLSNVVNVFQTAAIGIPMNKVVLRLTTTSGAVTTCNPVSSCSSNAAWNTNWPPSSNSDNAVGKDIYIRADYTFNTALAMFTGTGSAVRFGSNLGAWRVRLPRLQPPIDPVLACLYW